MIAHDRAIEQRVFLAFGGDIEIGGSVRGLELDGQHLARLRAQAILGGQPALDGVGEFDGIGAVVERDMFDPRGDCAVGLCRQGDHRRQQGQNPDVHVLRPECFCSVEG
ncbi:hypothetical protein D3C76_1370090 [compost metagenome]